MEGKDSGISCPLCNTTMVRGYIIQMGSGGTVYFSKEKLSWGLGNLGTLGKEKETILEDFPDNYSRTGYKCNNCNAVLIQGKPSPTHIDVVRAAQAENEKENLKDRIRHSSRF